jgi:hypothetical protein
MGKSLSGPDWTDVAMLMSALGALHTCLVALTVTADIQGHNGQLNICAEARFELLPGSSLPTTVTVKESWPGQRNGSVGEAAYNAVWQLDYQISQVYEQMELLPKA